MGIFAKIVEAFRIRPRELPAPYGDRLPDIQLWREHFGNDFALADRMLCIFCDAFMFEPEERYRFRPEDNVWEIYRVVYPSREIPDCLENTFLIQGLEKVFAFKFDDTRLEEIDSFQKIVEEINSALKSAGDNARFGVALNADADRRKQ